MNDTTKPAAPDVTADQQIPVPPTPSLPPGAAAPMIWQPQEKSPVLTVFLALVFLGHFYVGKYQRAVVILTCFFLSIFLLPVPVNVFVPIFIWFFNLFDAYRMAQLVNLGEDKPVVKPPEQASVLFGVFLVAVGTILLVDRFFPITLEWLRDWWPALIIIAGVYVIVGAIREQKQRSTPPAPVDDPLLKDPLMDESAE